MKVFNQPIEGKTKNRTVLVLGNEEVDILHGLLDKAWNAMPSNIDTPTEARIKNMRKVLSIFTGKSKEKISKLAYPKCPYCARHPRGGKALQKHIKDTHSKDI